jgi:hypothetical protein
MKFVPLVHCPLLWCWLLERDKEMLLAHFKGHTLQTGRISTQTILFTNVWGEAVDWIGSSKCLFCLSKKKKNKPNKKFKINKNKYSTFRKRASRRSRGARRVQNTVRQHSSCCWQQTIGYEASAARPNGHGTWTTVTNASAVWLKILSSFKNALQTQRRMKWKEARVEEWMNSSGTDLADFSVLDVHLLQIRVYYGGKTLLRLISKNVLGVTPCSVWTHI